MQAQNNQRLEADNLGLGLFYTLFGFAAGVFFATNQYVVMALFLALAAGLWLSLQQSRKRHG